MDLRIRHPYLNTTARVRLFPGKQLLLFQRQVVLVKGANVTNKFTFDEDVVTATFTGFADYPNCLVVCLSKSAFIYSENNDYSGTVSFPYAIRAALPFEAGIVLDQIHRFVTLIDPIGEFRVVTSSSTSIISPHEELMCFPVKGLICATFNAVDHTIILYHIKSSTKRTFKYKSEDLNMEKKRTSTLLSEVQFVDPSDSFKREMDIDFKKDMIFTKIESFNIQVERKFLDIYNVTFDNKEAIIIMNRAKKEARVYIFNQSLYMPQFQLTYSIKCLHCHPLSDGLLVILKDNHLAVMNPFVNVYSSPVRLNHEMKYILSTCDEDVAVVGANEKTYIIKLTLRPTSDIILRCLRCFQYLSGTNINETIWSLWRSAIMLDEYRDDWRAFVITILALVPVETSHSNEITELLPLARKLKVSQEYAFQDMLPYITMSLHLIREEMKLDVLSHDMLGKFGQFLAQLCCWMGWSDTWYNYYNASNIDREARLLLVFITPDPPNILESLSSLFSDSIIGYLTFSQLVEESFAADALIIPRTHAILKIFELIVTPNYGPRNIVDLMCELGIDDLDTFPAGIRIPLKEAILYCQENPDFQWTSGALNLVGRKDLNMILNSDNYQPPGYYTGQSAFNLDKNDQLVAWDDQSEADRLGITKLIFDYDRRYYEITSLLHQTKTQTATLITEENMPEYDVIILQRELAAVVALRTLSLPLGRASLFYGGRMPLLTERFPIPKFNLNTLIAPKMTNIVLSDGAVDERIIEWGYFHNGVASGLSISKQSKGISGSWIIFNRPPTLNAQHAGFLLGLGLNGHLRNLEEWYIYNYLASKNPLTSVGLLIGMSASKMGSMDIKLTKVLSIHAVALLPQGANDLNVPVTVQEAGLLGIGLLYLESQHRRMSEMLLSQITNTVSQNDSEQIHEGYRLAAGISLGLVNLAKGRDLKGLIDTKVVDRLLALVTMMKDYQPVQELDKSCSGAIIALGFMYMKTEDSNIASKLAVPENEQLLDYIRPDLLLLRCIAKNIIMWNSIGNSRAWVLSQIPEALLNFDTEVLDSDQIGYYNILGGVCLSMAIKYASTHDTTARSTLLYYLDKMMVLAMSPAKNYDQRIACYSATNIQNILALSLSVVMAGSGDLETFRRLRVLYGDTTKDNNYGNYMAINMALGFLFLGGGQYAFGNSNLAIACMIISLYPVFPNDNGEYEVHLQALRHFWAIAIEPRCLVVRDIDTHKPSKIPVTIKLKTGETKRFLTPCLIPNLEKILSIETESSDYFKVRLDHFKDALTIFVYRKRNYELLKYSIKNLLASETKALQIKKEELHVDKDIARILKLDVMKHILTHEREVYLSEDMSSLNVKDLGLSIFNIIDNKIELVNTAKNPGCVDDLWNLKLVFAYADKRVDDMHYVSLEFIEMLKHALWETSRSAAAGSR